MSKGKKFKGAYILLILAAILAIGIFGVFYRRKPPVYSSLEEDEVLNKVSSAQNNGGEVLLDGKDIEVFLNAYIKDGIKKGNFKIDGVMADVIEDDVSLTVPLSYSNRKIMASVRGNVSMGDGKYIFRVRNFKVGFLPFPKVFLFKKISEVNVKGLEVRDSSIEIEKSLIPLPLNSIDVRDGLVALNFIKVDKKVPTRKEILDEAAKKIDEVILTTKDPKDKNELKRVSVDLKSGKVDIEKVKKELNEIASKGNKTDKKMVDDIIGTVTVAEDEKAESRGQEMLKKTSKQIPGAVNSLTNSEEKNLLNRIQSTINIVIANPKYNYKRDAAEVKAKYKGMNDTSKANIKGAVLKYIDVKMLYELRNIFGV